MMKNKKSCIQIGCRSAGIFLLLASVLLLLNGCGSNLSPLKPADTGAEPQGESAVNSAIIEFEPVLAVRAPSCVTCHAKINAAFITDFGYGDDYFFGQSGIGSRLGPFSGHIYGDFYGGEPNKTAWLTATLDKEIVVPKAEFDFDLQSTAVSDLGDQAAYQNALGAESLAGYLQEVENQKANPSKVIETETVFIGAPDAATLKTRFDISPGSDIALKFIKNDDNASPEMTGIVAGSGNTHFTNAEEVICDGDLFVGGILFLNSPTIRTNRGCRIYATGPIILQKAVSLKALGDAPDLANLQLVSSEAILLGVGEKNCAESMYSDPLATRFQGAYALNSFITRETHRMSVAPRDAARKIYEKVKLIPDLDDASCHDDSISYSRILLNAPQVHSRYRGTFKGLVIAEFALFRLGQSSFDFDPVFKKVPILPVLRNSDYLLVE